MTMKRLLIFLMTAEFMAAGCASIQVKDLPEGLRSDEHGRIVRIANGEMLSPREVLEELAQAEVIYAAENHASPAHHEVQKLIVEGLVSMGREPVLAFEMLEKKYQPALDAYLAGDIAEDQFLDRIDWPTTWGYSFAHYRPLFQAARSYGLKALAINADRSLVRAVGKSGRDGLPEEFREHCPPLDSGTKAHRAYIRGFFSGHGGHAHGHSGGNFERFYQAQLVWDETMASNVMAAAIESGEPVVVFAGRAHIEYAHGIPSRASKSGDDFVIVIPVEKGKLYTRHHDLRVLSYPEKAGDFFWESSSFPGNKPVQGHRSHGQ